ncbi:MAG: pyrroline-5-carboxylate reductase dimerization domain-containing protein [Pseudomonadota bacterium]
MPTVPSPDCRLGIIGVGHLARAILTGLLRAGWAADDIILSPRGGGAQLAAEHGFCLAPSNAAVVARAPLILLSVRPADAVAALSGLPFRAGQTVMSACAGVPLKDLSIAAPASVMRIMPLTASALGASPTLVHPENPAAAAFLAALGTAIPIDSEAAYEAATANSAVYGWVQMLVRETAAWTSTHNVPAPVARALAAHTFVAAGRMILESEAPMDDLLKSLCTPGGITEAGLKHLEGAGVPQGWRGACDVVLHRLNRE